MIVFFRQLLVGSLLAPFFLFAFSLFVFSLWAYIDVDPHHDGIMLKPAVDVIEGKMLFRDSFTQYGAFSTLLQAWFCALFGKSLYVLRTLTLLTYSGTFVLLYLTGRRALASAWVFYVLLLGFIMAPFYVSPFYAWSSVFALFFTMLTCYLLTYTEDYPESNYLWAGLGIASILPFWCRQPCGLAFAAVLLYAMLFRWNQNRTFYDVIRRLLIICTGALSVSALFIAWICYNGAWNEFVYQSFCFAMKFASHASYSPDKAWAFALFDQIITSITCSKFYFFVLALTLIVCIVLLYHGLFRRPPQTIRWSLMGISLVCLSSLHQYFPVAEPNHFYWAALPAFLLYGVAVAYLIEDRRQASLINYLSLALGIYLAAYPMYKVAKNSMADFCHNKPSCFSRISSLEQINGSGSLEGMYAQKKYAEGWNHLCRIISELPEEHRNRPVLNLTPDALYPLMFPNHKNWHRAYMNWGNSIDPDYTKKVERLLQDRDSIVLLYADQELDKQVLAHGYRSWQIVRIYFPYVYYISGNTARNFPDGRVLEILLPAAPLSAAESLCSQQKSITESACPIANRRAGGQKR